MKTQVERLDDTKVKLNIALGEKELADAKLVALNKLAEQVKVPGFRKGKVPVQVAEKNVDKQQLEQQILEDALSKAVSEAFLAEELQALNRPNVDVKKYVPGKELEFTAETEVMPEVKLGDYEKLSAKLEAPKINDEDVEEFVNRMREQFAEKKDVERAAKMGDEAVINFVGKKDGEAFEGGTGKDYTLNLGGGQFIPGFEEGVVGKKAGEKFDLELEFPKDYHAKDLAGEKVVFETELLAVKEVVKPELNDEFAAKCGPFTAMDELRTDIKRELETQKQKEAEEKLKDELVAELTEKSEVPVPEILVDDQEKSIEQDFTQNLMYQGLSLDMYLENKGFVSKEEWQDKEVRPAAEKRVKSGLVLAELSKELKIDATSEELAEHISTYKQQYGNNPEALKQFDNPEVQRDIANRLLTEKTVNKLVELNR